MPVTRGDTLTITILAEHVAADRWEAATESKGDLAVEAVATVLGVC